METDTVVIRGFSNTFARDKKVEVMDLQFIEGEELERTWKAARRQRLKQQEEKIWNNFVKEEDVLKTVSKEDPYQFLDQMPDDQVKDLFDNELTRIKKELEEKRGAGDSPRQEMNAVTFSEMERDEIFEIYDDKDEDSGGEDNLNDTLESPCTVREREDTIAENAFERDSKVRTVARASGASVPPSSQPTEKNSSENVATVIENSIYCAKVKDLRIKIIAEIQDLILSLENQNLAAFDSSQLRKMCARAAEYSARFQRIHLYQLQRQVNDIKRHNSMATPYAKHTQFQSQMVRIVALHQNTLQSLQVFHKSLEHTACLRECGAVLCALCGALRDSSAACRDVPAPSDFSAARELYSDNLLTACDELEEAVKLYLNRVDEYIAAAERVHTARGNKKAFKSKLKKRNWSQKGTKNTSITEQANERLSMYSLETLRLNKKKGKGNGKGEKAHQDSGRKRGSKDTPKSHRKSPRARRPLMRDPHSGQERRRARTQPDHDIQTMVEAVDAQSSHMSGNTSPSPTRRSLGTPRKPAHKQASPRGVIAPPFVPPISLRARAAPPAKSPLAPLKRVSPYIKPGLNLRSETMDTVISTAPTTCPTILSPVSKVQCAKKDFRTNEDSEVQTMIIFDSPRRVESYRDGADTHRTRNLDSSRSETSRSSQNSRRKPFSARSEQGKEAEGHEMTRLLKQLCAGDTNVNRNDRLTGSKNAQLVCVNATSPRQPTTPQLLRILEETIQKKIPKNLNMKPKISDADRMRLAFNIPQKIADNLFHYRTKFVQHMLTSCMYANSTIGKPWEMVGTVSEQIIDEIILQCAQEMQIQNIIKEIYDSETR